MIKLVHHEMVINSKFLEVPRSYYQRHLNASRVKRIAAEFDERIANAPKVSYRDGHYYVFDGQHTIAARKLLNNNSDLNIVCKVYSGLTEQEEALLFAQQTGISAPLTAGAKLRAKIHGGDPEAIAFQSATQRAGFGLSFNQSHAKWKIACILNVYASCANGCPFPRIGNLKWQLIIDATFNYIDLLIIRIIPSENDRFMLVTFDFALFDKLFFFCVNTLQQNGGRFIGRVLRNKFSLNSILEN